MTTTILQHTIEFWWTDEEEEGKAERELSECDIDHIEKSIKDEYHQGELCQLDPTTDEEVRGWWKITN